MSKLLWSIDSLIVRGEVMFGFGWVFHPEKSIISLNLNFFSTEMKIISQIKAEYGKLREDIWKMFTGTPMALNSGFLLYGAVPRLTKFEFMVLECTLVDGTVIDLPVPRPSMISIDGLDQANKRRLLIKQYAIFFKRGLHLVRIGNFTSLFEKIGRYLRGRPKAFLQNSTELTILLKQQKYKGLCVILDHDLGGGANQFRERLINSLLHNDYVALILTFHVPTLTYVVILRGKQINTRYAISDPSILLSAAEILNVKNIFYNTGVSFSQPEDIPSFLITLKAKTSANLTVFVHDYFMICPSHFLLDYEGKFCRIPDLIACKICLPNNNQGFATLFAARDMQMWRSNWSALLESSDEIISFSNDSSKILLKSYPSIKANRISIKPHKINDFSPTFVTIKNIDALCIGVVGMIGFHKGAQVVKSLASEIRKRNSNIKIIIIGTIEASCDAGIVQQTGPYKHDDLPRTIERTGINVILFPSICPETFSYVVHELVNLQMPVASFNFGAPAERLSSYSKGLILNSMEPGTILDQLISFHQKIYLTK